MSTSQAPTNLSPSYQILFQKQQEHAGLQALRETSANLLEKVEKLAEMSNIMADGGEGEFRGSQLMSPQRQASSSITIEADDTAVGAVLRNWPHVFSILNLFGEYLSSILRASADTLGRSTTATPSRSERFPGAG
jgi:hypothetical protein